MTQDIKAPQQEHDIREAKPAMWRGFKQKCPNCGVGKIFYKFLKVSNNCQHCNEALHHHRADDGPAYFTILIVAHILAFAMHFMWVQFRPDPIVMAVVLSIGCIVLSLFLLPRFKGAIIALQWAKRMHGFK